MDVSLVLVLIALAASLASAMMTWHLLRRERERSSARVSALSAAIDPMPDVGDSLDGMGAAPAALFDHPDAPVATSGRIRLAVVAGMALVATLAVAAEYRSSHRTAPASASASSGSPLELMSMRHLRDGDAFTVRGLVRNPRRSRPVAGLTAVVLAFDRQGTFLTSARAPIDFTTLEPGDESPFAVTFQAPGDIARYRVTFRTEAGVLRHIDRRDSGVSLAVNHQ